MSNGSPGIDSDSPTTVRRYTAWLRDRQTFQMVGLAFLIGVLAGTAGVALRWLIDAFHHLFFEEGGRLFPSLTPLLVLFLPALGGLVVGLMVVFLAHEARGAGVADVVAAVLARGSRIRARVAAVKVVATSLVIGSGGSAGIEGPIVQIGSAIGSAVGQRFRLIEEERRVALASGAAAGIAATFNTPLAGVFFALEVILVDFSSGSFGMVAIAAVSANMVARLVLGSAPLFPVPHYALVHPAELLLYLVLALLAAFVGVVFTFTLDRFEAAFARLDTPDYVKPAMGGLLVGAIGIVFPRVLGLGYDTIGAALGGNLPLALMAGLVVAKLVATSLTVGSGASGGVIGPSLYLGAVLGGAVGVLFHSLLPQVTATPGAYALVGMAAVFAATAHAPITAIFTLFEMTGDYNLILPLMLVCVASAYVAHAITPYTIYSVGLGRRGIEVQTDRASLLQPPGTVFVHLRVGPGSSAAGKQVKELDLPAECVLVSVRRRGRVMIPRGDTLLQPGDRISAVCLPRYEGMLREMVRPGGGS